MRWIILYLYWKKKLLLNQRDIIAVVKIVNCNISRKRQTVLVQVEYLQDLRKIPVALKGCKDAEVYTLQHEHKFKFVGYPLPLFPLMPFSLSLFHSFTRSTLPLIVFHSPGTSNHLNYLCVCILGQFYKN